MLSISTTIVAKIQLAAWSITPLLAQLGGEEESPRAYSIEVGLVMLCVILGLLVALRPSKRTTEFKKPIMEDDE